MIRLTVHLVIRRKLDILSRQPDKSEIDGDICFRVGIMGTQYILPAPSLWTPATGGGRL